jgi:hypothetical protein
MIKFRQKKTGDDIFIKYVGERFIIGTAIRDVGLSVKTEIFHNIIFSVDFLQSGAVYGASERHTASTLCHKDGKSVGNPRKYR